MTSRLLYLVEPQDCLWICYKILRPLPTYHVRVLAMDPGITYLLSPTGQADAQPRGPPALCAWCSVCALKTSNSTNHVITPESHALLQTVQMFLIPGNS